MNTQETLVEEKEKLKKLGFILKRMHLSSMASELEAQMNDPNADLSSFSERFSKIVMAEWNARQLKKFKRLVKHAELKYPGAYFDESLYDPKRQLDTNTLERLNNSTDWIDQGRNLLITGLCGSGKSYYVNALAISAMHKNKTVRYTRSSL